LRSNLETKKKKEKRKRKKKMKTIVKTPKKIEKVVEVVTETVDTIVETLGGHEKLLGKKVYCICTSYAYTGTLTGVNQTYVEITDPAIVYESGPWTNAKFTDVQKLPTNDPIVIQNTQIESMFSLNK
jgi:hypothetical protein